MLHVLGKLVWCAVQKWLNQWWASLEATDAEPCVRRGPRSHHRKWQFWRHLMQPLANYFGQLFALEMLFEFFCERVCQVYVFGWYYDAQLFTGELFNSRIMFHLYKIFFILTLPSVLWRCWLGGRKGIRSVKNRVVGYWRGYLSGARCRLAYGPADATATHCLLLQ